ncbi:hypothetical protein [Saccharibacter floricola]|uniref:DUF2833 domain-containing protein n=1 Tax=Saccharibacter floricola DSM 15669 TaxID=1123227 RepID=A0ABQ0P050_9PROT|nr:hypothetical protein [Saccharibacter floricola]GBQ07897.1 hypothetical protein AA15669_1584 [Saccharibacter floricola DSM 15669]
MLSFRLAHLDDAALITPLLRTSDRLEVLRSGQGDVTGALRRSIEQSSHGMAGLFYDENGPIALFGVAPQCDVGIPWLVGTPSLIHHQKAFLRETRFWVRQWQKRYPLLMNHVDASYSQAIRWLSWLGFQIEPPQPTGLNGALFCRFSRQGED